jgi:hypothetical protein
MLHLRIYQASGMAQMVEHLSSKCEALSSNPVPHTHTKEFIIYVCIYRQYWKLNSGPCTC